MKHIVFFSGGVGSYFTAKRVIALYGKENVILLFTDTLIEDQDLYRFMKEACKRLGVEVTVIADGRTPWEIFEQEKFIGNSRVANCSKYLKQAVSKKWVKKNFKPDEAILYLGIDWTEQHRTRAPEIHWKPYQVKFPMCDEPYLTKQDMLEELEREGIEIPKLYKLQFQHNNCGGFCVRGGHGHFKHLYEKLPELYKYHEEKEQALMKVIEERTGEIHTILKRQKDNVIYPLSLKQLREEIEISPETIDSLDIGGCGCMVDY